MEKTDTDEAVQQVLRLVSELCSAGNREPFTLTNRALGDVLQALLKSWKDAADKGTSAELLATFSHEKTQAAFRAKLKTQLKDTGRLSANGRRIFELDDAGAAHLVALILDCQCGPKFPPPPRTISGSR
jgi:hypothetical protein